MLRRTIEMQDKPERPCFNHFMVDLETTGLNSTVNGIINFGIVPFCLLTYSHAPAEECLSLYCDPTDKVWDDATLLWHQESNTSFFKFWHAMPEKLNPMQLAIAVEEYVKRRVLQLPRDTQIYFWAKPAHFDWPFVDELFGNHSIKNPWHYRNVICMNSFLHGAIPGYVPMAGTLHTAFDDAIDQVNTVIINLRRYTYKKEAAG